MKEKSDSMHAWVRPILLGCLLLVPSVSAGQDCSEFLEQYVKPNTLDDLGYRYRDNRCEGILDVKKSGSTDVAVVSLTSRFDKFSKAQPPECHRPAANGSFVPCVSLRWSLDVESSLLIRARADTSSSSYRMDMRTANNGSKLFVWDVHLLMQSGHAPSLGVYGVLRRNIRSAVQDVYVPISLETKASPESASMTESPEYRLRLKAFSGMKVRSVRVAFDQQKTQVAWSKHVSPVSKSRGGGVFEFVIEKSILEGVAGKSRNGKAKTGVYRLEVNFENDTQEILYFLHVDA